MASRATIQLSQVSTEAVGSSDTDTYAVNEVCAPRNRFFGSFLGHFGLFETCRNKNPGLLLSEAMIVGCFHMYDHYTFGY